MVSNLAVTSASDATHLRLAISMSFLGTCKTIRGQEGQLGGTVQPPADIGRLEFVTTSGMGALMGEK